MKRAFGILLLIFGSCCLSFGHNFNFTFLKLSSIESGLSQSTVNAVIRDSKGDFWIGTHQGLNHYTLHGLHSFFTQRNDSTSLPSSYIFDIVEDHQKKIWISTRAGVVTYDRREDNFRRRIPDKVRRMLVMDDGVMMGGEGYLLYFRGGELRDSISLKQKGEKGPMAAYRVFDMVRIGDTGKILVGTSKAGIFIYDTKRRELSRFSSPSVKSLLAMTLASSGDVYASYYGDGCYRYDSQGRVMAHYSSMNSELNNDYILDIMECDGYIYLATDGGGINLLNVNDHTFNHVLHDPGNYLSLPIPSVTVLYRDEFDNLWAGSVREGVFLISDNYIKTYGEVELGNESGMSENAVTSLYEEGKKVWIGTDGGGLNLFDSETNRFVHFKNTLNGKVISIAPLDEDRLLVSAYTKGFYVFNKVDGRYRKVPLVDSKGRNIEPNFGYQPRAYRVTDSDIMLVGTKVYIYDMEKREFEFIPLEEESMVGNVKLVFQNDDLVLLKRGNRAYVYDTRTRKGERLFEIPENENINTMSYDGEKIIWVGTSTGLGYVNLQDPVYHPLNSDHFSYVSYLHLDRHKRLWICAHNMLFSYSLARKKFAQWNRQDGFSPNEILSNYHRHQSDDYIYMAGAQGFVKIDMDIPDPEKYESEIAFDDVLLNDESLAEDIKDGVVSVPWNYYSLSVRVNIKNKDVFQQNHLLYKVVGDNEQTISTESPELALSGLSPGTYNIFVSNNRKSGEYIDPVHLVDIRVLPPWYATLAFRIVAVVILLMLFIGIVYVVLSYQKKNLKGSVNHYLQALLHQMDNKEEQEMDTCVEEKKLRSEEDEALIRKLNRTIEENISNEEFGVNMLAEMMGVSRASLYNKVKNLFGMGVNDYINKIRIERSVYLLTHTDMSITEISYEVGFNYPRYFSTSFKNMKGISPSRFKEENKKKKGVRKG